MVPKWTIWLDGKPYSGESPLQEQAKPTSGMGWSGKQPPTRNRLNIGGAPLEIQGKTNLRSHITRILDRMGYEIEASEITIQICR